MGLSAKPVGKKKGIEQRIQNELDKKARETRNKKGRKKK